MSAIWIVVVLGWVVISAFTQAKKMQRPGNRPPAPPPVARPLFPYNQYERPQAPAAPQPRPVAAPLVPAPAVPAAPARPLLADTGEAVDTETERIAAEAQALGTDAERLTSASDTRRSFGAVDAEADSLGWLTSLRSDIREAAAPTPTRDTDAPDPEVPLVDERGVGPKLSRLGDAQTLTQAVVYAEVLGRPVAQRRHHRGLQPVVRR